MANSVDSFGNTNPWRALSRRCFVLALATAGFLAALPAFADPAGGGPRELLITYRSKAADRPAFRTYLSESMTPRLEALKRSDRIADYQVLFNPFPTTTTWDAMLILSFARFEDTQHWKDIERTTPGGLDAEGLALASPIFTYSADLAWEGTAPDPGPVGKRVAYVIPYTYKALPAYKSYVDGYVLPQIKGWMKEGILSRYRLYLNRFPVGDPEPWDSLFVYEYRDMKDFGRREGVLQKTREPLKKDPVWAELHEKKSTLRYESENTIADLLPKP